MKIDEKTILLRFRDKELEKEFHHFLALETLPTIRLGIIFGFFILAVLTVIAYYYAQASFLFWLSVFCLVSINQTFILYVL